MENCSWVFVTPADLSASFVLSDHPAAPLKPVGYSWQGIVMPLAPRSAVCVTFGAPALGAALLRLPQDHVDGFNRIQLRVAAKHAFGLRPDLERAWNRLERTDDEEISQFGACLDACHRSADARDGAAGVLRVGRAMGFRAPIINDAFGPWGVLRMDDQGSSAGGRRPRSPPLRGEDSEARNASAATSTSVSELPPSVKCTSAGRCRTRPRGPNGTRDNPVTI